MTFNDFIPLIVVSTFLTLLYLASRQYFKFKVKLEANNSYYRQLFNAIFVALAILIIIIASPIESNLKGQIIGLVGILLSGAIALSSTTVLGNLLAGIVLRMTRRFKAGDFIEIEHYFGKVSARSLLNIEIQTIDRGLISLPNLYLVSHPLKILPASGVFISVEVSLGYEIPRSKIESALLLAAENLSLTSAYVEVNALLDHAIVYKLHVLVTDLETLISSKSKLHASVIDALHAAKIEIVSPRFMNSRSIDHSPVIPPRIEVALSDSESIDDLLFEKANNADKLEMLKNKQVTLEEKLKSIDKDSEAFQSYQTKIDRVTAKIAALETEISQHDAS